MSYSNLDINRVKIFNKMVFPASSREELLQAVKQRGPGLLIAVGCEKLLNKDPDLQNIINSNIAYCDGYAAKYAVAHRGFPDAQKIPGAYLWLDLIRFFPPETKYYLLGAKQDVISDTVDKLKKEFPINIVGWRSGYFDSEEEVLNEIRNSGADVVFVALGSPKQEFVMDRFYHQYPATYMGLGGSFDLYTGRAKPVPAWWNKIFKWEGLYRQLSDFTNLKRWKRQFIVFRMIYLLITNHY